MNIETVSASFPLIGNTQFVFGGCTALETLHVPPFVVFFKREELAGHMVSLVMDRHDSEFLPLQLNPFHVIGDGNAKIRIIGESIKIIGGIKLLNFHSSRRLSTLLADVACWI